MQRRSLCSWEPVARILAVDGCPPDEQGWTERNWTLENVEIAIQFSKDLQKIKSADTPFDLPLPSSSMEELSMFYNGQPQH
ncbi:hypothetical protein CDAR_242401 [Caerostris darwini]|uniref:Uncharacterized protein n=1 Tax=Caerostris darwini TaxID=1538125 RepID=A0AAV4RV60_9ARAC|nr:hypothetical protein CDAR_242401 [Caerostris darwini]